jgi:signal transduction histidine kinase
MGVLTSAAEVRRLDDAAAAQAHAVRIEGVVTYYNPELRGDLVVQDATAGLYVLVKTDVPELQIGDHVVVSGYSHPGSFAPVLAAQKIVRLGPGALPEPRQVSLSELANGADDCRYVEVTGVVRAATPEFSLRPPRLLVEVVSAGQRVTAYVLTSELRGQEALVDAAVRVRGVCFHFFNRDGQQFGRRLMVANAAQLTIERAAPENPLAQPATPFTQLLRTASGSEHRVRVRGTVTAQRPGAWLAVTDGARGLLVQTRDHQPQPPGTIVDVLGFAAPGEYNPVLQDAEVRAVAINPPPEPLVVTPAEALLADAQLVRIEARLHELARTPEGTLLVLQNGDHIFTALWPGAAGEVEAAPGSWLALTGVCFVKMGRTLQFWARGGTPESFRLELRDAADISVLARPPWWTLPRALALLAATSGLALGGWAWSWLLARRVAARTRQLAEEIGARHETEARCEAVNAERHRLAAELHDTLEQGLTGISLQVEAIAKKLAREPAAAARHIELARHLVRQSQAEVRRSVWDLQSPALQRADWLGAFREIAEQLAASGGPQLEVRVEGAETSLPESLARQLLRIGQEAITNALKHAQATRIELVLECTADAITLTVRDNGRGFTNSGGDFATAGHFGLRGMSERARRLGGEWQISSTPGGGTTVRAHIPIPKPVARSMP